MKYLYTIIICLFGIQISIGQIDLNLLIETEYPQSHLYHMIVDNDTIVGYGLAFNDTIELRQGLLLIKADSSGTLIQKFLMLDTLGDHLGVNKHWGGIIKTSDGGYAFTAAPVVRNDAWLVKLDHHLNIEFIKVYPDTVNLSNFDYTVRETKTGYILYGHIQKFNGHIDGFIRHVDKQGKFEWQREYGENFVRGRVTDAQVRDDTTIILNAAILTQHSFNQPEISFNRIEVLNLEGELLKSWESDLNPDVGTILDLILLKNDELITYGRIQKYAIGPTEFLQSTVSKFDADFNLIWNKPFGETKSINAGQVLRKFEQTKDGNFIGVGENTYEIGDEPTRRGGWLYHFSVEGDSIWSMNIEVPLPPLSVNRGYFGGVGVLSGGNIIAGGGSREDVERKIWLVKVACSDTLFCSDPISDIEEVFRSDISVNLFPNPAQDDLTLQLSEPFSDKGELRFFNAVGQSFGYFELEKGMTEFRFSVSDLEAGMYFYSVRQKGFLIDSGRIIIQK